MFQQVETMLLLKVLCLTILVTLKLFPTVINDDDIGLKIFSKDPKGLGEVKSHSKLRRTKARVQYYSNTTATFNLILSGDIEINPGPGLRSRSPKCTECNIGVGSNRKRLQCTTCLSLTHATCSGLTKAQQTKMTSKTVKKWLCKECVFSELPFFHTRDLDESRNFNHENFQVSCLLPTVKNNNQTSIAHINTQSLLPSMTEFCVMLEISNFDIITLSETWLQDNQEQLDYAEIPGYNCHFKNRTDRRGGGVGIYAKESLRFKIREDLIKHCPIEVMCTEFCGRNKNNAYLVIVLYQPSSQENEKLLWLDHFETLVANVTTKWNGTIIIAGDTNIDLLGQEKESTKRYKDILVSYNLSQRITQATRKGKTLIDHIITNNPKKVRHSNVLCTDEISDHDTPFVVMNIKKDRFEPRYKFIRDVEKCNFPEYINDVSNVPFSTIYAYNDPEDQVSTLNQLLLNCIDQHAPLKRVKLTRPIAPWMKTPEILELRKELEAARENARNDPSLKTLYQHKRNDYQRSLKKIKNSFYKKSLSSKNPKTVWSTIKRVLNNQKARINHKPAEMNDYFSSLASNLTGRPNTSSNLPELSENINDSAFTIKNTTYEEVYSILTSLKNDCSSGYDNIPVRFLKPITEYITSPLVHIINNCIDQKCFPKQWKIARVCPIPKIDSPTEIKDYRPISVLPLLSKVYERVILSQLCIYIESNNLYNETQSGFRKGHSTATLLLKLRDDIKTAMSKSEITLSILIDYSKAFDTIDHTDLILKLYDMNFSSNSISIISSYLSDRYQYVQIEDKKSPNKPMHYGVPQGSILGPVLFNLYVIEISSQMKCKTIQYADDTTLYRHCKASNILTTIKELETDVNNLLHWSKDNNLLFNSDKLQFIIFNSKRIRSLNQNQSFLFRSSGKSVEQKENVKLLGLQFDRNLTWSTHVNNIIKSSQGTLRTLRKFSRFTPFQVRKLLAETMILSRMNYCNVVFSELPQYMCKRLQKIQNITAGYVFGRYATIQDVIKLNWIPMREYIDFNTVKLVHKSKLDANYPKYLKVDFCQQRDNLRSTEYEPLVKHGINGTFQEQARCYNDLPTNIKTLETIDDFNSAAKQYFLDRALAKALSE